MNLTTEYIRSIRFPFQGSQFKTTRGTCDACGLVADFTYSDIITTELASDWGLNQRQRKAYSIRESMACSNCNCSARCRALAKALVKVTDSSAGSLAKAIELGDFDKLSVAEINGCGSLHPILAGIRDLRYSEFGSTSKDIKSEDLQNLSYPSDEFHLVITSETLEHVPDYHQALAEVRRVLKPGGYHVFTIPLLFSRNSRRRVQIKGNEIQQELPPSYHGTGRADFLVCTEFGIDFLNELKKAGFSTQIYFGSPVNKNEVNYVLVSQKV